MIESVKDVELTDVLDRVDDMVNGIDSLVEAAKAASERKPDNITVTPNVNVPKPECTVHAPVTVNVPERKVDSYFVHDIERDDSKLIKSFRITVEQ